MSTAADLIAHSLTVSQSLMVRYTNDLKAEEYLHRTSEKANCAAWTIGHLILTERGMLKQLGITDLAALPDGFEHRFSRDEGCPQAHEFGDVTTLMPLFNEHRNRAIETVRSASQELLNKPMEKPRPPLFTTVGEYINFLALHTSMHAGQITLIRRSLGRPPLV